MNENLFDDTEEGRPAFGKENIGSCRAEQAGQADHPYIAQLSLQTPRPLRLGDAGLACKSQQIQDYICMCMYVGRDGRYQSDGPFLGVLCSEP